METQPHDFLVKLLLVGDSGVGKSCFLRRFSGDPWAPFTDKIGVDFKVRTIEINGTVIKLQMWDLAPGQARFRTIPKLYWRGAMGILLVYDVTDECSFNNIRTWHSDVEQYASESVSKILIGNKSDWEDKRAVTEEQGRELANELSINLFMEASAKVNEGVEEAFFTLAGDIKTRLLDSRAPDGAAHERSAPGSVNLNQPAAQSQSGCCS